MKRFAVLSMVLIVCAICSSVALADQTAIGNLGKPDQTGTRTFTDAWPLSVPTASCARFPGTLFFPAVNVPYSESFRVWNTGLEASPGSGIFLPWFEGIDTFAGSTTAFGSSYSVHGIIFQSRLAGAEFGGPGKVFVTGANGAHVSGDALVFESPLPTPGVWVSWIGTPGCN